MVSLLQLCLRWAARNQRLAAIGWPRRRRRRKRLRRRRPRRIELLMPPEPGESAVLRAWHQRRGALPDDVRAVLAAADLAAERTAARLRLGVLILIGLVLVGLGSLAGVYREGIATTFALNLGVSVAAVVLARPAVFRSSVPWVVATLDAGVVLGVMIIAVFAERVSASYTP